MRENTTILEETSIFVDKIKQTPVYIEYRSALEGLRKQPELKARVDAFREQNYRAYTSLNGPVSFADVYSYEQQRMELAEYPQIDRYLKAELALCRAMQDLWGEVVQLLDFE